MGAWILGRSDIPINVWAARDDRAGCRGQSREARQIWLGAAIFGIGYMTLAFGRSLDRETWPSLPTDYLLNAIRRVFPPIVGGFPTASVGTAPANARIWVALEQPVPMRFPNDTTLEDVMKFIESATHGPDGKGIPIYVDPLGLQDAERSMTSTVTINLEGVALKTSLRLCLDQLGLSYGIRDGILLITSAEREVTPVYQDPFLIVGHCLLALLAAGFGGTVAPLIFGGGRESTQDSSPRPANAGKSSPSLPANPSDVERDDSQ